MRQTLSGKALFGYLTYAGAGSECVRLTSLGDFLLPAYYRNVLFMVWIGDRA
jgi:hypothetical protein